MFSFGDMAGYAARKRFLPYIDLKMKFREDDA